MFNTFTYDIPSCSCSCTKQKSIIFAELTVDFVKSKPKEANAKNYKDLLGWLNGFSPTCQPIIVSPGFFCVRSLLLRPFANGIFHPDPNFLDRTSECGSASLGEVRIHV